MRRGPAGSLTGLMLLLVALATGFSLLIPDGFLRVRTVQAMMFQLPELGILSLAMVIPLISGGINLAIIATANRSWRRSSAASTPMAASAGSRASLSRWRSSRPSRPASMFWA